MSEPQASFPRRASAPLPGFVLEPLPALDDGTWWRGIESSSAAPVLMRAATGVPFAGAINDIGPLVDLQEACPGGIAPPLAVAIVAADGQIVAAAVAADAGFTLATATSAARAVAADALVDVFVVYRDSGSEVLAGADHDPGTAAARLLEMASSLDTLHTAATQGGHHPAVACASLDGPGLRVAADGPLLLAVGLDGLDAMRRNRLDAPGPWRGIPPEMCLPPGLGGPRGHVYTLATLWATARTGRPPFPERDASQLVRRKL